MTESHVKERNVIIIGINSDIGHALKDLFIQDGWKVSGTCRTKISPKQKNVVHGVDLKKLKSIDRAVKHLISVCEKWDLLIFAAGTMKPIGPYFEIKNEEFINSLNINFIGPLILLKKLWKHREKSHRSNIIFFAGGGTNSSFDNYSAYGLSKVAMIKMVEFLASENPEVGFFSIGPGFVNTKIHQETIEASEKAGLNLDKTENFLRTEGTSMQSIYDGIHWCINNSKSASGRNFSIQHDLVQKKNLELLRMLRINSEMFKLRRHMNNWKK
jgi:NAD(P)-dependent dehydrogenase (short-subunit alcohol dehydrogenase family)